MKFSLALLAAAACPVVVAGTRRPKTRSPDLDLSHVHIEAGTKAGSALLSKARRLDGGDDTTWIAGYSLKFHACTTSQDYYGGNNNNNNNNYNNYNNYNNGDNGNGNNNGYYYNNQNRDDYQGLYQQKLVHFQLCPSDSCWRCTNGAEYVVELGDYVDAALEAKMTAQEYNCERVREMCYCENASSEETCLYNCYKNAQMEDCAEAMYEDAFDLQEAVECVQLEVEDEDVVKSYIYANTDRSEYMSQQNGQNGNNGNNGQDMGDIEGDIYVGPYCSKNGKKIHLGVFLEETCSYPAPAGIYEALHYGDALPYSKKSIVDSGCISCKEPKEVDYENYWDQQDADEVTDVCTNLYEIAGKCEEKLDGYYPNRDVSGCSFISNLKSTSAISMPSGKASKVFAGIFAATTALLAAVSMTLFKRNRRANVSLVGDPVIS